MGLKSSNQNMASAPAKNPSANGMVVLNTSGMLKFAFLLEFVILQSEFAPNTLHVEIWKQLENLDKMEVVSRKSFGLIKELCTKAVDAVSQVLDEHSEEQKCFHEVRIFYGYFEFADKWCKRLENSKKIQIPAMGKLSLDSKGIQINCFGKDKNVMAEKALKLNPAQESGETKMSNDHNDPGAIDLTKIDAFRINDKMEDILNEKS